MRKIARAGAIPPAWFLSIISIKYSLVVSVFYSIVVSAMQLEEMYKIDREASPFVHDIGDSLLEISYLRTDLTFSYTDTFSNISYQIIFDPTINISDQILTTLYLSDNFYTVIVNCYFHNYVGHYFYRYRVNDTCFIEERYRDINLPDDYFILDAKSVAGGGYLLLYMDSESHDWWRVCRINDDGNTLWTRLVLSDTSRFRGYSGALSIIPSTTNPAHYYIFGRRVSFEPPIVWRKAQITLIDTAGVLLWTREYYWSDGFSDLVSMEGFHDGTYAVIGTRRHSLLYMHLAEDGDSLATYRFDGIDLYADNSTLSLVTRSDKLLILTHFDNDDPATSGLGLIYINEEGDSLDGCYFHTDTVNASFNGPMIERPDGKVMLWVHGTRRVNHSDILYTFYPDGRPGEVAPYETPDQPACFLLHPAYPNPFNSTAVISFSLPVSSPVSIKAFDLSGREVKTLTRGFLSAGEHRLVWNAGGIGAGSYLLRLETPIQTNIQKVNIVK